MDDKHLLCNKACRSTSARARAAQYRAARAEEERLDAAASKFLASAKVRLSVAYATNARVAVH